jgi:hypothetical protein
MDRRLVVLAVGVLVVIAAVIAWRRAEPMRAVEGSTDAASDVVHDEALAEGPSAAGPRDAGVMHRGADAGAAAQAIAVGAPPPALDLEMPTEPPPSERPPSPPPSSTVADTPPDQIAHAADVLDLSTQALEERQRAAAGAGDTELARVLAMRIERQRARAAALRAEAAEQAEATAEGATP